MVTTYLVVIAACFLFVLYTYLGYPLLLRVLAMGRPEWQAPEEPQEWPRISITVPAFNEEHTIRGTIDSLLSLDYPADRRQILIVSDASTDRTDEIVLEYADQGVELCRVEGRVGKTAAENEARSRLTGDIIINTDASIRIKKDAIKELVRCFQDPTVGVASGRDISTAKEEDEANVGEAGYVGYEMWVRSLETRVGGIVQASGCLYAVRRDIHTVEMPVNLTRDYGAVAFAREGGYRAVSVDRATCQVPRQSSLKKEFRRKARTMTRGLKTVWYRRTLLNPFKYGLHSWKVFSHKYCRWLVPVVLVVASGAVVGLGFEDPRALPLVGLGALVAVFALLGWAWPDEASAPKLFTIPAYLVIANVAALRGWWNLFRGASSGVWSPTRR